MDIVGHPYSSSFKTLGDFRSFITGAGDSRCGSQRGEFQVLVRLLFSIVVGGSLGDGSSLIFHDDSSETGQSERKILR